MSDVVLPSLLQLPFATAPSPPPPLSLQQGLLFATAPPPLSLPPPPPPPPLSLQQQEAQVDPSIAFDAAASPYAALPLPSTLLPEESNESFSPFFF